MYHEASSEMIQARAESKTERLSEEVRMASEELHKELSERLLDQ